MNTNTGLKTMLLGLLLGLAACGGGGGGSGSGGSGGSGGGGGANTAPVARAGDDQVVNPSAPVTLDASASSDADGDTLAFAWTQTGGATVTLQGGNTAIASFTAPGAGTTLTFSVAVGDGSASRTDEVTVTVLPDTSPESFGLVPVENAVPGFVYDFGPVMLRGFEGELELSVSGGSHSLNGAPFSEAPAMARAGDELVVRVTAGNALDAKTVATVTLGERAERFVVRTGEAALAVAARPGHLDFSWNAFAGATHYRLLENHDGVSGFTVLADNLADAAFSRPVAVHLVDWNNARYQLEACNAAACATVSADEPVLGQPMSAQAITYLKSSIPNINDRFGTGVSLSADGNTLAVGASGDLGHGSVAIFTRGLDGEWLPGPLLVPLNGDFQDQFGLRVALSANGGMLAVSAHRESSDGSGPDDDSVPGSGAVYVFERDALTGTWTQRAYLKASNPGDDDQLGFALAISADGSTVAAGAFNEDSNATSIDGDGGNDDAANSGAVYVFARDEVTGDWAQQAYIKTANAEANDNFGLAVTLSASGSVLAAGAWLEDGIGADPGSNAAPNSGAVYIFERDPVTGWIERAYLKASNLQAGDSFGSAVTLSPDGMRLASGAPGEDSDGSGPANDGAPSSGALYVFDRDPVSGDWIEQALLKAALPVANASLGHTHTLALSADGNRLVAGTSSDTSEAVGVDGDATPTVAGTGGAAHLFRFDGDTWQPHAFIKSSNPESGDQFNAVALSADGARLVVGAPGEDSNATGVNGEQSDNSVSAAGAVYVY